LASSTERLAEFIVGLRYEELPKEVVSKAKYLILDSVGCCIAGCNTEIGKTLEDAATQLGSNNECTVMGSKKRLACHLAGFVNATTANISDYDDIYLGHGGATIVPTALALGERSGVVGKEILEAVVAGYEVHARVAAYVHPPFLERHTNTLGLGTNQTFDATATACRIFKLDKTETVNALGIGGACAPVASVLKTVYSPAGICMVKNNFGFAVVTGILAAHLAEHGYTGPSDILDGDKGFWRMQGVEKCYPERLGEKLGEEFKILNVRAKRYPANGIIHATLDAVCAIMKDAGVELEQVEHLKVETSSQLAFPIYLNPAPVDRLSAEFSIPYTVSVVLSGLEPGPGWYGKTIEDSSIRSAAKKVEIIATDEADALYREKGVIMSKVTLRCAGKEYVQTGKAPSEKTLTNAEIVAKFKKNTEKVIADPEEVVRTVLTLEDIKDVRELMSLLAKS
jgi:2-methylcitrate dehydratase PrpD